MRRLGRTQVNIVEPVSAAVQRGLFRILWSDPSEQAVIHSCPTALNEKVRIRVIEARHAWIPVSDVEQSKVVYGGTVSLDGKHYSTLVAAVDVVLGRL